MAPESDLSGRVYTVEQLVDAFRTGLLGLSKAADLIELQWQEPNDYEEWESAAQGAYEGFVLCSLRNAAEMPSSFLPFARYDQRLSLYQSHSYVAVRIGDRALPFICFATKTDRFDTCVVATLSGAAGVGTQELPYADCRWLAVIGDGQASKTLENVTI